jgi:hypothetical protein
VTPEGSEEPIPGPDRDEEEADTVASDDGDGVGENAWADLDPGDASGAHSGLPPRLESWRRRSATGAILTGFALGLQDALEKKKEEPAIVMQTSGDPPRDLPVEAEIEYGRPRQSVVQIRSWLLGSRGSTPGDGEEAAVEGPEGRGGPTTGSEEE